jgi:NAD(P)-dependent dehydrogenase (short-subunit alcohol dehydrogenase family)
MNRLQDKTAIITGGSSGIGFAIAQSFLTEGAKVLITGRDPVRLADAAQRLGADRCLTLAGDVSEEKDCAAIINHAQQQWGRLDILVNNAGVLRRDQKLCEVDPAEWDDHLAINLKAVFLLAKFAIPVMSQKGGGSIVNISSQLAFVAAPKYPAYCAAKSGVNGLTRSIALDYGDQGIRCNAVCPGLIDTPLARVQREDFDASIGNFAKLHPLGRIGQPEDVALAVVFLASDEASWITGQTLIVDGGYTIK